MEKSTTLNGANDNRNHVGNYSLGTGRKTVSPHRTSL